MTEKKEQLFTSSIFFLILCGNFPFLHFQIHSLSFPIEINASKHHARHENFTGTISNSYTFALSLSLPLLLSMEQ